MRFVMRNKRLLYGILFVVVPVLIGIGLIIFNKWASTEAGIPDINDRPNIIEGYSVYTSADDRFRIQYPSGWVFRDHLKRDDGCVVYRATEKEEEGVALQSVVVIACSDAPQYTSEDSLKDFLKDKLYIDDANNIAVTSTENSVYKGFAFSGTYPHYGHTLRIEGKIAIYDEKSYIIEYDAESADFDNYINEARKIMSTFEIIKSDASPNCYCSLCVGGCVKVGKGPPECPVPPEENYETCANSYCTYENGECETVPLPKWE